MHRLSIVDVAQRAGLFAGGDRAADRPGGPGQADAEPPHPRIGGREAAPHRGADRASPGGQALASRSRRPCDCESVDVCGLFVDPTLLPPAGEDRPRRPARAAPLTTGLDFNPTSRCRVSIMCLPTKSDQPSVRDPLDHGDGCADAPGLPRRTGAGGRPRRSRRRCPRSAPAASSSRSRCASPCLRSPSRGAVAPRGGSRASTSSSRHPLVASRVIAATCPRLSWPCGSAQGSFAGRSPWGSRQPKFERIVTDGPGRYFLVGRSNPARRSACS